MSEELRFWVCEWCGMKYPQGCFRYWELVVSNILEVTKALHDNKKVPAQGFVQHVICDDCKQHLKPKKTEVKA